MNRVNPLASKADNSKIGRERSVNVSSASVKNRVAVNNKAAVNRVAVNKAAANGAAVSKPDDKTGPFEQTSGGR
jgi:hypothetical protein